LTRRQRAWAYAGVVAAVLAAWQLQKLSFALTMRTLAKQAPAPVATIDTPAANAEVGFEITVEGRAVHETIRGWLWLLTSEAGHGWRPEGPIATGAGSWRQQVLLNGRKGMHYRFAVVAGDAALNDKLKKQLYDQEHPLPWSWVHGDEQVRGGMREWLDWRQAPLGDGKTYPPLPEGAALVTFADVTIARPDPMMDVPPPFPFSIGSPSGRVRRGGR
jgi:hypothetical protein